MGRNNGRKDALRLIISIAWILFSEQVPVSFSGQNIDPYIICKFYLITCAMMQPVWEKCQSFLSYFKLNELPLGV